MNTTNNNMITKFEEVIAEAAIKIAHKSVDSTCLFLTYQPDVPEELSEENDITLA